MTTPMSDERLQECRDVVKYYNDGTIHDRNPCIRDLIAEVERLREEVKRIHESADSTHLQCSNYAQKLSESRALIAAIVKADDNEDLDALVDAINRARGPVQP